MDNFYIGQRVQIKTWDEMIRDGAKEKYSSTKCPWLKFNNPGRDIVFPAFMKYMCGAEATIKGFCMDNQVVLDDFTIKPKQYHTYTLDMIKPRVKKESPIIWGIDMASALQGFQEIGKAITGLALSTHVNIEKAYEESVKPNADLVREAYKNLAESKGMHLDEPYLINYKGTNLVVKVNEEGVFLNAYPMGDLEIHLPSIPWCEASEDFTQYLLFYKGRLERLQMVEPSFKPKKGENYFFVHECGQVVEERNDGTHFDCCNIALNNAFRNKPTDRQVKNMVKRLKGE